MKGRLALGALLLTLAATSCSNPSEAPTPAVDSTGDAEAADTVLPAADLPDLGPAPELVNRIWLNSETPLRLSDLRGQVVLLDFWTFG